MDANENYDEYARPETVVKTFPTTALPPVTLRGLVFDVCGVLYDDSPWRHWLLRLLNHVGLHARYGPFYRVWDRDYQDDVIVGRRDYWDAMADYLRSAGISRAQFTEIEAAGRAKRVELEEQVCLFPGVRRTIEQLSARGVRLSVACSSPWPVEVIEKKLARLAIRRHFRLVLTTRVNARIGAFHQCIHDAAEALNLDVEQIGYVGSDPLGLGFAHREHARTIAVNSPRGAVADVHLRRFEDLLGVVPHHQVQRLAG